MAEPNVAMHKRWNEERGRRLVWDRNKIEAHLKEVTALLLEHAAPRPGEAVLEIGSGYGSIAVILAQAVLPLGWVMGVDFSEPMVKEAEKSARRTGLGNLRFRVADMQTEKLKEGLFDLAVSRFWVMFFDDPTVAFTNIRKAMKPGGRLSFVCWAPLERNPHWAIQRDIAIRYLGPPQTIPAGRPGPMSLADPERVRRILSEAGWHEVTIDEKKPTLLNEPIDRAIAFATTMGPAGELIREHNPPKEVRQKIEADIGAAFGLYEKNGKVQVPGAVYLVGART